MEPCLNLFNLFERFGECDQIRLPIRSKLSQCMTGIPQRQVGARVIQEWRMQFVRQISAMGPNVSQEFQVTIQRGEILAMQEVKSGKDFTALETRKRTEFVLEYFRYRRCFRHAGGCH